MHEHDRWNRKLSPAQCNTSWIRWEDLQGSKLIGSDRWKMFSTVQLSLLCLSYNHIQSKHIDDTLELWILLYCWNLVLIITGLMSSLGCLNWRKERGGEAEWRNHEKKHFNIINSNHNHSAACSCLIELVRIGPKTNLCSAYKWNTWRLKCLLNFFSVKLIRY